LPDIEEVAIRYNQFVAPVQKAGGGTRMFLRNEPFDSDGRFHDKSGHAELDPCQIGAVRVFAISQHASYTGRQKGGIEGFHPSGLLQDVLEFGLHGTAAPVCSGFEKLDGIWGKVSDEDVGHFVPPISESKNLDSLINFSGILFSS